MMSVPVPDAFRLQSDVSPASWIVERLRPWGKDRVRLWSFLPDVFEAYARVLHPPFYERGNKENIRWSDLAARNGVKIGPATGFREVSGIDPEDQTAWYEAAPSDGTLEREQLTALATTLALFTGTSDRCWLAAWEGWGTWRPGSSATLMATAASATPDEVAAARAALRAAEEAKIRGAAILDSTPRVEIPHRAYFLFSCRLVDIPAFAIGGHYESPSIWWPEDRAWCVVTEIDGYSTYVGGTTACIEALIASSDIEALEVPADVPMDPWHY